MRIIKDKKELMKLCSFITMGDGGVYPKGKNHSFSMNMKAENLDYINYCKDILENITSASIYNVKVSNKDGYNRKPLLKLQSKSHPYFNAIRERIYTDSYKGLDPHAFKLFDWECLAILYMCDGCLHRYCRPEKGMKNESYNVTLNLKRLSYGDQLFLKKQLKDKLGLEWNINRQGKYYYLRLRGKDIKAFMNGISKFILPSFSYKVLYDCPLTDNAEGGEIVCSSITEEASRND